MLQVGSLLTALGLRPRGAVSEGQVQGKEFTSAWAGGQQTGKKGWGLGEMLPSCEHEGRSVLLARQAGPMASHPPSSVTTQSGPVCLSWVHMRDQRAREGSISKWESTGRGD